MCSVSGLKAVRAVLHSLGGCMFNHARNATALPLWAETPLPELKCIVLESRSHQEHE